MNTELSPFSSFLTFIRHLMRLVLVICLCVACSVEKGGIEGKWIGERRVSGNVTTVRTISGSVWGGKAVLVEESSIGTSDQDSPEFFGSVQAITTDGERIYILDTQVPVVRIFDMDGGHLIDIGRSGDGPGEFRRPWSIAIDPTSGNLFVEDSYSGRINIYNRYGESAAPGRLLTPAHSGRPIFFADNGLLYTSTHIFRRWGAIGEGYISWDLEGAAGDTIDQPMFDFEPWLLDALDEEGRRASYTVPFSPGIVWDISRNRDAICGVSSDYRFEVRRPDGTVTVIERDYEPTAVLPEERWWYERARTVQLRNIQSGWVWNGPRIPNYKPVYDVLHPDQSDRIWVRRPGPGIIQPGGVEDPLEGGDWRVNPYWIDSFVLDVFSVDGRFLGEVETPDGLRFSPRPYIRDDLIIALAENDEGIQFVKRYRLLLPEQD